MSLLSIGNRSKDWTLHNRLFNQGRRRAVAVSNKVDTVNEEFYPRCNVTWAKGRVDSATPTSVTVTRTFPLDGDGNPTVWKLPSDGYADPWGGNFDNPGHIPAAWDLVIGDCQPLHTIHAQITNWTANSFTVDLRPFLTEKTIPNLAYLKDKIARVIKRDGIDWSERRIQWKNDPALLRGIVAADPVPTSTYFETQSFHNGELTSIPGPIDIAFADSGGVGRRANNDAGDVVIGHFADGRISFAFPDAGAAPVAGEPFYVIPKGAFFEMRRAAPYRSDNMLRCYIGNMGPPDAYVSHAPGDDPLAPSTINKPAANVEWTDDAGAHSVGNAENDVWTPFNATVGTPDESLTPWIYWSHRGQMADIERWAQFFMDDGYANDGAEAFYINNFARVMQLIGNDAWEGTITSVDGAGAHVAVGPIERLPRTVYYAIYDEAADPLTGSPNPLALIEHGATTYDGSVLASVSGPVDITGMRVLIAAGWHRLAGRRFQFRYTRTGFFPTTDEDGDPLPIDYTTGDPPTRAPGHFFTRLPSDHYIEIDDLDRTSTSTYAEDVPAEGDHAEYMGSNRNDPNNTNPSDPLAPLALYFDAMTTCVFRPDLEAALDALRAGEITDSGPGWIEDDAKDWYAAPWGMGTTYTETITATGGNDLTLEDSTRGADEFWAMDRHNEGAAYPGDTPVGLKGFILEALDGPNMGDSRPVASQAGTTLTFARAWPHAISAAQTFRRREALELNRWQERTVIFTHKTTGEVRERLCTHSSDDRLFFSDGETLTPGEWTYFIGEIKPGTVCVRTSGQFVRPTGIDPRNGKPYPTTDEGLRAVVPTAVKKYGRMRKDDYPARFGEGVEPVVNQINNAWKQLKDTFYADFGWSHTDAEGADVDNRKALSPDSLITGIFPVMGGETEDVPTHMQHLWDGTRTDPLTPVVTSAGEPPYAVWDMGVNPCWSANGFTTWSGIIFALTAQRAFAVPTVTPPPTGGDCPIDRSVEFYAYWGIDAIDSAPVDGDVVTAGGTNVAETHVQFDANGLPAAYHKWKLVAEDETEDGTTLRGAQVGTLDDLPEMPTEPTERCDADGIHYQYFGKKGCYPLRRFAIVRWNFSE